MLQKRSDEQEEKLKNLQTNKLMEQGPVGQYMRRVYRRTIALPTSDRPTNQPTDTASYRRDFAHVKKSLFKTGEEASAKTQILEGLKETRLEG